MTGWQPIATAPKDGPNVLLRLSNYTTTVGWRAGTIWDWLTYYATGPADRQQRHGVQPTHWMPLPAPPQETP